MAAQKLTTSLEVIRAFLIRF